MNGLVDTKNEYIEHLQDILSIPIAKKIYNIYNECIDNKKSLKEFQTELVAIKKWNNNTVKEEYKNILKETKCKYFDNLIKIIIITSVKIKIYEYKDYFDNIKIKIPEPEDFVHKCYINISLYCWKNAYLFNKKNIRDSELQNNLNIIEENIRYIIKKTFRDFIPINDILEQIQNNLTNNVQQFSEAPKKGGKENKLKKEEVEDVSDDSSEEEAEEDSDGGSDEGSDEESDKESNEGSDEGSDEGSHEESDERSDEGSSDEGSDKKNTEYKEKETIENESLYTKEIIDKTGIIEEEKKVVEEPQNIIEQFTKEEKKDIEESQNIIEQFTKEDEQDNISIKNEEDYKEEELPQKFDEYPIETVTFDKNDVSENMYKDSTEVNIVTDIEDQTDIVNDNIKRVSIELPENNKPKKLSFF